MGRALLVVWSAAMLLAPLGCDLDDSEPVPWTTLVLADGAVPGPAVDAGPTAAWATGHAELELTGNTVVGYDPALLPLGPPHAPIRTRASADLDAQCRRVGAELDACRLLEGSHVAGEGVEAVVLVTSVAAEEADGSVDRLDLAVRDADGWRVVARVAEVESGATFDAEVRIDASPHGPLVVAVARSEVRTLDRGWDEITTIERATLVIAGDRGDGLEALAVVPVLERVRRAIGEQRMVGPNVPPAITSEEELGWRLDGQGKLRLWVTRGHGDLRHLAGEHVLLR